MAAVGVDIVEIERIQKAVARWGRRFLGRVFTGAELEVCAGRSASLAGRFAAKEAVMKALGGEGLGWREIEVLAGPGGRPVLRLHGRARQRAEQLRTTLTVSLSHCRDFAVAVAVGLE